MKKLGFMVSSLALLASCKTVPQGSNSSVKGAESQAVKLPIFNIQEWHSHPGGPAQDPFSLQNQIYNLTVELPALPTDDTKISGKLTLKDAQGKVILSNGMTLKLRGTTSRNFAKKQYGMSFYDEKGNDKSIEILGMTKSADWVLAAPYNDKSLLRDITLYNISNKLGRKAPLTRIVNLTAVTRDGGSQNMGIYVITEKNEFAKGRIDVPKKNEAGDVAFQATFDHLHDGDNVVWSGRNTDIVLEAPSKKKITPEQQAEFLANFNDAESRVANPTGERWDKIFEERLDLDSAVDFFIGQELARNADGFRLSSTFYAPPKGKFFFGPLWDFNIAFGNAYHEHGIQYDGWRSLENGVWFGTILKHPEFCSALKKRWTTARKDGRISNDTIYGIVDKHAAIMAPVAEANFQRWPSLGTYLWPNPYWLKSWDDEKDALKSWISLRTLWMDEAIEGMECDGSQPINWARERQTDTNDNQFCDEGETCQYTANGMIWARDTGVAGNHIEAFRACQALSVNGEQWALPRSEKLIEAHKTGIWNAHAFPLMNLVDAPYWSGNGPKPIPGGPADYNQGVYTVNPRTGEQQMEQIGNKHRALCVKAQ